MTAEWDSCQTGRTICMFFLEVFDRTKFKNLNINFDNAQVLSGHGRLSINTLINRRNADFKHLKYSCDIVYVGILNHK